MLILLGLIPSIPLSKTCFQAMVFLVFKQDVLSGGTLLEKMSTKPNIPKIWPMKVNVKFI